MSLVSFYIHRSTERRSISTSRSRMSQWRDATTWDHGAIMWVENVSYVWSKGCRRSKIESRMAPRSDNMGAMRWERRHVSEVIFHSIKDVGMLPS